MVWWRSAGVWTCALSFVHLATTGVFYADSARSVLDVGVLAALDRDPELAALRGVGFWYVTAGLLLGGIGVAVARHEHAEGRPPRGFAALMAGIGLWGVLLTPASGFWLFFAIAALAGRNRARSRTSGAQASTSDTGLPT